MTILSRDHGVTQLVSRDVSFVVSRDLLLSHVLYVMGDIMSHDSRKKGNNLCKYPQLPPEPQSASSSLAITGIYRLNVKKRIFSLYPVY